MKICPDCGRDVPSAESVCPICKIGKNPFSIKDFLWENFRLFTMVGVTGTMISLIPNMGSRVLGASWIVDAENFLPLFLSVIIFFGALFLTLCFLMIFSLIFRGRKAEFISNRITLGDRTLISWYEGDSERSILLGCLVPMWSGLILFFIMLMPLIPNTYSWLFAVFIGITVIPLAIYALVGWKIAKTVLGKLPGIRNHPRVSTGFFILVMIGCLVLLSVAIPTLLENSGPVSGAPQIRADPQYFSPHISSAKGVHLTITNISGRKLQESRHTWSADYGYFIRVSPTNSEVTILGNPVTDDGSRDISWTYPENDPGRGDRPVKIDLHLYTLQGNEELAHSSLFLTWFTDDIIQVNRSYEPLP